LSFKRWSQIERVQTYFNGHGFGRAVLGFEDKDMLFLDELNRMALRIVSLLTYVRGTGTVRCRQAVKFQSDY
jgi:hypothetical protein